MVTLYLLCLILSMVIFAGYCIEYEKFSFNILGSIMVVIISNAGYYFLSIADDLDTALLATRLSFAAGCFLPVFLLFCVIELCQAEVPRGIKLGVCMVQALLYGLICSMGYNEWFFVNPQLGTRAGVSYIEKGYGPLHDLYALSLLFYFILAVVILLAACKHNKKAGLKNIILILSGCIIAITAGLIKTVFPLSVELSPMINTFLVVLTIPAMKNSTGYHYILERMRMIHEQKNNICFISFNTRLEYTGCNEKAKKLFPELAHMPVYSQINRAANPISSEIYDRLREYKQSDQYDDSNLRIDDRDLEIRIHAIRKGKSRVIGYLVELTDITERMEYLSVVEQYNQKLKEEVEEKTRRVQEMQQRMVLGFDHSRTAYSVIKVEVDEQNQPYDWSYVYVNDAMARMMGIGKEELLGRRFLESFPDGDKKWLNYYFPAAYEGKRFVFEATPQEIGIYMKVQCFPLDYGFCGCVLENASSANEIMRNKAEIQMINDALCSDYVATYVVDMETGYTHLYEKNSLFRKMDSKLFVRGHYDDFSKVIAGGSFVVEADRAAFNPVRDFEQLKKTMSENQHYILSYRMVFRGQFLYYQTHFAMTYDGNRNYCIIALKNTDAQIRHEIEQKQIIEDALRDAEVANQSKSSFLSSMSHEIRTPINAILGMDEMIIRECKIPEIRAYARNIQSAGKTLLGIINDILDFSKIESGKMEIIPVEYDLSSVINDLVNMMRPKVEEKNLEFVIEVADDTPALLYGDEIRIKQIMLNLLGNAVKYTEKGSVTLKIGYEHTDSEEEIALLLAVSDTGKGIKEEDREKLFKPFERLDEYNNRSIEGTGLGISITQNLLSMMGSELEVKSVYGEGSTFSCRIPQALRGHEVVGNIQEKYKEFMVAESDYREIFRAPSAQILVVDDVQMNLYVVRDLLKETQVKLDLVLSGSECVKLAEQKQYDLILLDHMMPEMDGFETFNHLKQSGLNQDTPVVILTANAISGAREKYMEAGFTDYLTKPIDSKKLENLILKYLPQDKIIMGRDDSPQPDREQDISEEDSSDILKRISQIDYINLEAGISALGSRETFLMVMREFCTTGSEKYNQIASCYETEDIKNYTIYVHGMKSSARLIGYGRLSDLAAKLEQAGLNNDLPMIQEKTSELLDMLSRVTIDLEAVFEAEENKPCIPKDLLIDGMSSVLEVAQAHDFDSVDMIMGELDQYLMPEGFRDTYKRLKIAVSGVDRDGIINIITDSKHEWMGE